MRKLSQKTRVARIFERAMDYVRTDTQLEPGYSPDGYRKSWGCCFAIQNASGAHHSPHRAPRGLRQLCKDSIAAKRLFDSLFNPRRRFGAFYWRQSDRGSRIIALQLAACVARDNALRTFSSR